MLTSKQRAYLRSLAVDLDTIVMVGKSGMSPELTKQADDALTARELIKGKVLETAPLSSRAVSYTHLNHRDARHRTGRKISLGGLSPDGLGGRRGALLPLVGVF